MISNIAKKAGMKIPKNPNGDWSHKEFPRFNIFCYIALGKPVHWASFQSEAAHNAKIVTNLKNEELETVTVGDLVNKGVSIHT